MSPDPYIQAPYNTQSYNRYTYVFNNPLSFTDPSGYLCLNGVFVAGLFGCDENGMTDVSGGVSQESSLFNIQSRMDLKENQGTLFEASEVDAVSDDVRYRGSIFATRTEATLEEVTVTGKRIPISYGYGNNDGWLGNYWDFMQGGNRLFNQRAASGLGNMGSPASASPYLVPSYSSSVALSVGYEPLVDGPINTGNSFGAADSAAALRAGGLQELHDNIQTGVYYAGNAALTVVGGAGVTQVGQAAGKYLLSRSPAVRSGICAAAVLCAGATADTATVGAAGSSDAYTVIQQYRTIRSVRTFTRNQNGIRTLQQAGR